MCNYCCSRWLNLVQNWENNDVVVKLLIQTSLDRLCVLITVALWVLFVLLPVEEVLVFSFFRKVVESVKNSRRTETYILNRLDWIRQLEDLVWVLVENFHFILYCVLSRLQHIDKRDHFSVSEWGDFFLKISVYLTVFLIIQSNRLKDRVVWLCPCNCFDQILGEVLTITTEMVLAKAPDGTCLHECLVDCFSNPEDVQSLIQVGVGSN